MIVLKFLYILITSPTVQTDSFSLEQYTNCLRTSKLVITDENKNRIAKYLHLYLIENGLSACATFSSYFYNVPELDRTKKPTKTKSDALDSFQTMLKNGSNWLIESLGLSKQNCNFSFSRHFVVFGYKNRWSFSDKPDFCKNLQSVLLDESAFLSKEKLFVLRLNKFANHSKASLNLFLSNLFEQLPTERQSPSTFGVLERVSVFEDRRPPIDFNRLPTKTAEQLMELSYRSYFDWQLVGAISAAREQGMCGSCWAFGIAAAIEAEVALTFGVTVRVYEQHLLNCGWELGAFGCRGGFSLGVLNQLKHKGICVSFSNSAEKYQAKEGVCQRKFCKAKVFIDEVVEIDKNENALEEALKEGPVLVSLHGSSIYFYGSGIYDDLNCPETSNHLALLTGFGEDEDGNKFWVLKNSWGKDWGEGGFVRLLRKINEIDPQKTLGICGIASRPIRIRLNKGPIGFK